MKRTYSKSYSELIQIDSFEDRFEYLKLSSFVGKETFGYDRYLNQALYSSKRWKQIRNQVIIRDNGCDLASNGHEIYSRILIHHINPITIYDILENSQKIYDLENLICVTHETHNAIHFGDAHLLVKTPIERKPNDTCPWK